MKARAELCVDGHGALARMVAAPPLAFRRTPDAVYLVGTAAGPLGDDDLQLCVRVCDGGSLTLRSAAATVVYAGTASRQRIEISAGRDASIDWRQEPLIATAGCHHRQDVRISLAGGARLDWTEEVVLGRHGEDPGRIDLRLHVDLDGRPLLRHDLAIGAPGWDGPAVLGPERATGLRLVTGHPAASARSMTGPGWAWLSLAAPARLLVAHAPDLVELRRRMAQAGACDLGARDSDMPEPDAPELDVRGSGKSP